MWPCDGRSWFSSLSQCNLWFTGHRCCWCFDIEPSLWAFVQQGSCKYYISGVYSFYQQYILAFSILMNITMLHLGPRRNLESCARSPLWRWFAEGTVLAIYWNSEGTYNVHALAFHWWWVIQKKIFLMNFNYFSTGKMHIPCHWFFNRLSENDFC